MQAVVAAVQGLAQGVLPVPVTLEYLLQPLLSALGSGLDVAVAVIHIAADLGGQLAACHILPSLLAYLGCSVAVSNDAASSRTAGKPNFLELTCGTYVSPARKEPCRVYLEFVLT